LVLKIAVNLSQQIPRQLLTEKKSWFSEKWGSPYFKKKGVWMGLVNEFVDD
jgi:hypothetical protein